MSSVKNLLLSTGLVVAGIIAGQNIASAQECGGDYPPPPGTPSHCIIIDGQKVWVDINNNPVPGASEGGATFVSGEPIKRPCGTTQQAQSFEVKVQTKEFGTVVTTLDEERQKKYNPLTTIIANTDKGAFPATGEINVYLKAEADAFPGKVFYSKGVVSLSSKEVRGFPFKEQTFTLSEGVAFVSEDGELAFSLAETKVTLNTEQ